LICEVYFTLFEFWRARFSHGPVQLEMVNAWGLSTLHRRNAQLVHSPPQLELQLAERVRRDHVRFDGYRPSDLVTGQMRRGIIDDFAVLGDCVAVLRRPDEFHAPLPELI
jgi:hypothetical protein